MFLPRDIPNRGPYYNGPFVIWILHPVKRIITIRPSWDLTRSIIPEHEFPDWYYGGRLYSIAKELRRYCFYPSDQKIMPAIRRIHEHFMNVYYRHPGSNVIIDPWYFREDKCAEVNFFTGELIRFYDKFEYPRKK